MAHQREKVHVLFIEIPSLTVSTCTTCHFLLWVCGEFYTEEYCPLNLFNEVCMIE